jgi:hypothetical protein
MFIRWSLLSLHRHKMQIVCHTEFFNRKYFLIDEMKEMDGS